VFLSTSNSLLNVRCKQVNKHHKALPTIRYKQVNKRHDAGPVDYYQHMIWLTTTVIKTVT